MILLNDFRRQWEDTAADTLAAVERVGRSGSYILGDEVTNFEAALSMSWPCKYAVGVASGLDAIEIGLRVLGCRAGDKVLTTPLTAFATTLAIARIGAIPVFADCDDYGLVDLDMCADALSRDHSIRFFVPVHLYGHCLDMDRLKALRDRFDLSIVEDCAQSILAQWNGAATGSVGQIAATSFYPTKNLGALGDGGAILTNNADLCRHARQIRNYGQSDKYHHDEIGLNSRLDELQAAILLSAHLPRLQKWTDRRRAIARLYMDAIRNAGIRVPGAPSRSKSCWHLFPVFVAADRKCCFLRHLASRGIRAGEHYPAAVVDQQAVQSIPHEIAAGCAKAARLAQMEISLPIHSYLRDDEAGIVIEACNSWDPV